MTFFDNVSRFCILNWLRIFNDKIKYARKKFAVLYEKHQKKSKKMLKAPDKIAQHSPLICYLQRLNCFLAKNELRLLLLFPSKFAPIFPLFNIEM